MSKRLCVNIYQNRLSRSYPGTALSAREKLPNENPWRVCD